MPNSIDKRIVEMQFDNSNFERNISQSMKSLDTFKQQFNFTGCERGFQDLEKIANQVNFDNLTDSLNYLENRFSNLGIIGMTVVSNLTTSAMQSFEKISSSIIGMVKTGGVNRALNIENAKFQLEGLGVAWKDIEDDINYGVKDTAYGLDEAAKAASQLVASQVQLGDEMKTSLRGISGVAAMTNSSYSDIAHIFTTVAGNGKLMTMQLQQISYKGLNAAAALAKHLNISEAALREMVSKGKIDFKTFSEAMDDAFGAHAKDANKTFNGAMSNMGAAFSRLGDKVAAPTLENIRKMVVELIDVINDVSKALDPMINDFNDFFDGIRKKVVSLLKSGDFAITYRNCIDAIRYGFYDLMMILDPVRDAFRDIFPAKSLSDAKAFSERLKDFISTFYITRENAENLRRTFRGLFSVIDIAGQIFSALASTITGSSSSMFEFGSSILEATGDLGDYLTRLANVLKATNYFGELFGNIKKKIEPVFYFIKEVGITLAEAFKQIDFSNFKGFISTLKGSEKELSTLEIIISGINAVFKDLGAGIAYVSPILSGFFSLFRGALGTIGRAIGEAFTGGGWDTFLALVNGSLFTGMFYTIERILSTINGVTWKSLGILDTIRKPFLSARRAIDIFAEGLKYDNLIKIAKAVGILTLSLVALSLIDAERLENSLTIVTACILELIGAFKILTASSSAGGDGKKNLITNFVESIGEAAQYAANAANLAAFFIGFSVGILMMASAVAKLAALDMDSLERGLLSTVGLITAMTKAMVVLGKNESEIKIAATSIIAFALGIKILGSVVNDLASLDWKQLAVGLGGVGALIAGIGVFINKVDTESFKISAASMIAFSVGIAILAKLAGALSAVPFNQIIVGLGAVGSIMFAVGAFINNVDSEQFKLSAISMLGFAAAIAIMGNTASQLAALPFPQVITGVGAIMAMMLTFGAFINNVKGEGMSGIAASMVVMAAAMRLLTPAIVALASLDMFSVLTALTAMAGSLLVFGYGAQILAPAVGVMMAFAKSILMIGLGIGAATAGIALLVNVIMALAASGGALVDGISAVVLVLATMIPQVMIMLANGLTTFIKTIVEGLKEIFPPLAEFVTELANFIIEQGPTIMTAINALIDYLIQIVVTMLPKVIDAVVDTILMLGEKLADCGVDLAMIGADLIINLLTGLNEKLPALVEMAFTIIITLIDGLATAIDNNQDALGEAVLHLIDSIVNAIGTLLPKILDKGIEITKMLLKGLVAGAGELYKGVLDIVGNILKSFGMDAEMVDAGINAIKGLIDGMVEWAQKAIDKAAEIAKNVVDTILGVFKIESPSKVMEWAGEMIDKGLANGIEDNQNLAVTAGEVAGQAVVDGINDKVDQGIADAQSKMAKFDAILERWARQHDNTFASGHVKVVDGKVVDKDANKDAFLTKQQQLMENRKNTIGKDKKWFNNIESAVKETTDALNDETAALDKNSKATGGSSKAKEKNEEANEKKTKEIKEETDALNEESEAVEENTIDYQALAEEIEVVTEKFNEDLNWQGLKTNNKVLKSLKKAFSDFWSTDFSKNDINATFESVRSSLKSTTDYVAKGTYRFNDSDKLIKKLSTSTMLSSKKIKKEVETTGRTVIKVFEGQMKVFQKNQNGIEKFTLAVPKSTKNLAKFAKQALNFSKSLDGINVENIGDSKTLIENLRGIEKYFVKFKDASKSAQSYMKQVFSAFDEAGFRNSMNILGKNIDGVGNVLSKNSKATAYVEDAFISLAATLYDGSEAANQYATEHARLLFLLEHGEATEEEVAEHERAYIKRITDALVEYRNTLLDTLQSQMDIWKEFDKGTIEGGAETLLKNIESQIAGYQNWGNMLMELSKRGVDKDLMKTLTDEGVASYGKLEAMLQMTREQLALFNQDFKLSQQMIEQTADTALAAMANATNRASQRAAAQKGNKVAQAQLKLSKKTAKQMKEEYEAVAQAVLTTDKVTKKQEKEYLKTLTKKERQEYKKAKKELKAAEAEEKRLAEQERARIAEENRLKTVLDSIKTMDDYIKVITEYNNDSAVLNNLTTKMTEAFKDMGGVISNISVSTGDANDAFLMFAETLDATGQDGLNYFEEMAARVKKFTDEIKDSITGVNYLTTAFGTASKIKMADIYDNGMSNIIGNLKTSYQLDQLAKKGYNSYVLQDVINTWKSDKAQGLELITELIDADAAYVEAFNAMTEERLRMSTEISDKMTGTAASAKSKKAIETEVTKRRTALNEITNARIAAEQEVGNIQARINAANVRNQEVAERKRLVHLNNLGSKRTKNQTKEMKSLYKKIFGKKWKEGVVFSFSAQDVTPTDTSGMYWELANANAKVNELRAEETEKTRLLNEELAVLADYNAKLEVARKKLLAEANIRVWFENATTSINDFYEALKKVNKGSSEYIYAVGKIADVMKEFTAPIAVFNLEENFKSIKEQAKGIELPAEIKTVEDGLMKFGETLVDVTEDSDQFWTSMKQGLIDYQKELKNTIASSSDFFSMFEPDTDTTANDYLEYADSQIEGLKNWQEYLKKIADMGLDKEIVEKFASQGLSSYTQVSAWANATAEQIGEYNQLWKDYNESVESASNSAMASIAAAWSTAGQALQDSMINMFNNGGAERLRQVGYEASAMVITGVQDGIGGVLPTIISAIEKTSSESAVTTAVGKKIGTAINDGLVQAITSSVTNTVDTVIEKFKMAVDSVNSYANEVLQTEYTITIHVDASEMDAAIARMNAAISGTNVMANETSQAVTSSKASNAPETDATVQTPAVTNNVTYNQTINSPTAMNQVEIYRESQAVANQIKSTIALANG